MPAAGWRAGVVAVLLTGVVPAREARAQAAAQPQGDVDVTLIGAGPDADGLVDTIRELVGRLGLTLTPHVAKTAADVGPAPSARVIVEVDFSTPGEIAMSARSDAEHAPARRRIARDGSPAVVREEVADAVSSMVESQLMSDEARKAAAASPPEEPPAPPPPEPPPEPPPPAREQATPSPTHASARWFAVDLTTFAGAGPFAGNVGLVGRIGGGIVLASRRGLRPSLTVTGAGLLPFDTPSTANVSARGEIESFRAVAAIEILRSYSWFAVDVGAGLGFDVLSVSGTSTSPLASIDTYSPLRADLVACAEIAANVALTPEVMLTLAAIGDGDLTPRRYQVDTAANASAPATVLTPWLVRPSAFAGFTFTTFGDGRFASRDPR
jgi:hypothetical protein